MDEMRTEPAQEVFRQVNTDEPETGSYRFVRRMQSGTGAMSKLLKKVAKSPSAKYRVSRKCRATEMRFGTSVSIKKIEMLQFLRMQSSASEN